MDGDSLFRDIDIYGWDDMPPRPAHAYGPRGEAVKAIIDRALTLEPHSIERIGSVWQGGNGRHQRTEAEIAVARQPVADAARRSNLEDAVTLAFADGQRAILMACSPIDAVLEYWWNNYPQVPAMYAVGDAAAAAVVEDALAPEVFDGLSAAWASLDRGIPAGTFGPNQDAVVRILDEIPHLTPDQADKIVTTWCRAPDGDIDAFGPPGALNPQGLNGWMPAAKGRRHLAWIALIASAGEAELDRRRFEWAAPSAWMRSALPAGREQDHSWILRFHGALQAAVAAALVEDLVPPAVSDELLEAWLTRDGDVPPDRWQERSRVVHRVLSEHGLES